ncbi:MAG: two component transcriptional regulator, winged helix family [Thermoleophilia bacterium]|nr:two component transcriptional regulator, winged helix family [Thermoleophilia bacterium]
MQILVTDDDRSIRDALRRALVLAGYDVAVAEDGQACIDALDRVQPDAIVMDVGMPVLDGLEVCRRLRAAGDRTPILMLTARDTVDDRIEGLDAGADDYLVKPFDVGELKARIRALLRRVHETDVEAPGAADADPTFAELRLETARHGVLVDGERFVELTRTEYALLEVLLRNPKRVLTHDVIYDRVWGYDFGPESNALRVYVGYLRRKLEGAGSRQLIHTVRGVGYVLREPDA